MDTNTNTQARARVAESIEKELAEVAWACGAQSALVPAWRAIVAALDPAIASQPRPGRSISTPLRSTAILIIARPGSGALVLARRAVDLLGPWDDETERFEANLLHWGAHFLDGVEPPTIWGKTAVGSWKYNRGSHATAEGGLPSRPFRAPHHTVSEIGLCGGGTSRVQPGEVSLAHGGILLLDDVGEFRRSALEVVGHAIRAGHANIYRKDGFVRLPARPRAVIATMKPCPCGRPPAGPRAGAMCVCSPLQISAYHARIQPIRDLFPVTITIGDADRDGARSSVTAGAEADSGENKDGEQS